MIPTQTPAHGTTHYFLLKKKAKKFAELWKFKRGFKYLIIKENNSYTVKFKENS